MNRFQFGPTLTRAIRTLIFINIGVFVADFVLRVFLNSDIILYFFALTPDLIVDRFFLWQLFTYQFLHGGFFHILFNMLVIWMFGAELELKWGPERFLGFYLGTGAMTGVMIFLFNYLMGYNLPTIGASGVVFAIMLVYAIYWGDRTIYIWMIIPIRVKYFVMIMGGVSFLSMITPGQSNISHIGHFGGLISGYLYYRFFIREGGGPKSPGVLGGFKKWKKQREWEKKDRERYDNMSMEEQVDEILAKISRRGIKSLSALERKILKSASERMNHKKHH